MSPLSVYIPVPLGEQLAELNTKVEENDEDELPEDIREDIRTFFMISHAVFEERTASLICTEIIDDSVLTPELRMYFEGDSSPAMSQYHREEILYKANVISGELKGKLEQVRGARNTVAHEYNFHLETEWKNGLQEQAELAVDAYTDLLSLSPNADPSSIETGQIQ